MGSLGRYLVITGLVLAVVGVLLVVGERVGLGKLPGDIVWKCKNTTIYVPIVTSVLLSVVLTLLLNLFLRKK